MYVLHLVFVYVGSESAWRIWCVKYSQNFIIWEAMQNT